MWICCINVTFIVIQFSQFLSHMSTIIYFKRGKSFIKLFYIFVHKCLLLGHDQISYWNKAHIHGLQLKSYDLCEINEAETFLSKLPSYLLAESHNSIELNVIVWIETTFSFRLLMIINQLEKLEAAKAA